MDLALQLVFQLLPPLLYSMLAISAIMILLFFVFFGAGLAGWRVCDRCGRAYRKRGAVFCSKCGGVLIWPGSRKH